MDFMRIREAETELSLEEPPGMALRVVRRYRPAVLLREAVRGLLGGLVSVVMLVGLVGALGREWATVVGVIAGWGWVFVAVVLVRIVLRGGPVSVVAALPSRWSNVPVGAEAAAIQWAQLDKLIREEEAGEGSRALQQWAESEVDRSIAKPS